MFLSFSKHRTNWIIIGVVLAIIAPLAWFLIATVTPSDAEAACKKLYNDSMAQIEDVGLKIISSQSQCEPQEDELWGTDYILCSTFTISSDFKLGTDPYSSIKSLFIQNNFSVSDINDAEWVAQYPRSKFSFSITESPPSSASNNLMLIASQYLNNTGDIINQAIGDNPVIGPGCPKHY